MSHDIVALAHGAPDVQATVSALAAAGERVQPVTAGSAVRLCGDDGRPMVSVEAPQFIQVPGEVERLVGPETAAQAGTPTWWVEARASSAIAGAADLARRFAEQVVQDCGGVLWAPAVSEPTEHAVPGEEPVPGAAAPAADDPAGAAAPPGEPGGPDGPGEQADERPGEEGARP